MAIEKFLFMAVIMLRVFIIKRKSMCFILELILPALELWIIVYRI